MFTYARMSKRPLKIGDTVFHQAENRSGRGRDYLMIEGIVRSFIYPSEEVMDREKKDILYPLINEQVLKNYHTIVNVQIVRRTAEYFEFDRGPKLNSGEIFKIAYGSLLVYTGEFFSSYPKHIQLVEDAFYRIEEVHELGNMTGIIEKYKPNWMISQKFEVKQERENLIISFPLKHWNSDAAICSLTVPRQEVKAIFGDGYHIKWLNPLHYKLPEKAEIWPDIEGRRCSHISLKEINCIII